MRIKDIFNKVGKVLPFIGIFMGTQSYLMAVEVKKARLEQARKEGEQLLELIQDRQNILINNKIIQNKISTKIENLQEFINNRIKSVKTENNILNEIVERLKDPKITDQEKNEILMQLGYDEDLLVKTNYTLKEILDLIDSYDKNKFLNITNSLVEKYREFLNSLDLEHFSPLINTLGLMIITSCLISIAAIIYGDYFIKYFEIEARYPRLAKFILIRRKFQRYYTNFNFIILFIIIIILFTFNIHYFISIINLQK